jgi:hypothetical protein
VCEKWHPAAMVAILLTVMGVVVNGLVLDGVVLECGDLIGTSLGGVSLLGCWVEGYVWGEWDACLVWARCFVLGRNPFAVVAQ